jgi:hypothetical protein
MAGPFDVAGAGLTGAIVGCSARLMTQAVAIATPIAKVIMAVRMRMVNLVIVRTSSELAGLGIW